MTRAHVHRLALTFLTLIVVTAAITIVALAVQASAERGTATEYAEYTNDRWHYSLAVPADMIVSEHEREGGGQTIQFMDANGGKELIISAWPYTQLDPALGPEGTPSATSDQPDHLEVVNVLRDGVFKIVFTKTERSMS